jgi:hypothetical protein
MKITSYKSIDPITFGGGGYGNTYRFTVTYDNGVTCYAACERDIAHDFLRTDRPVPPELAGPYDIYGNKED